MNIDLHDSWFLGDVEIPTRSHHEFSGVPYHHLLGEAYEASRLGQSFVEALPEGKVV